MERLKKVARAAGVMGLTWCLAWFSAGMVLLAVALAVVGPDAADVPFPLGFGFLGFCAGALFSLVLALTERTRRFEEMSFLRAASWGAVSGAAFAVLFVVSVATFGNDRLPVSMMAPLFAVVGAASAAGSLLVARRGERRGVLEGPAGNERLGSPGHGNRD